MTGRLQLIEQKLLAIDPAGFQNLCDTFLILRAQEYSSLNRTGSQLGKQKTVQGTPDSFIRLDENKLAYIEYTTQADSKVSKIKDDIDKCLDEDKTGIPSDYLYKIIICVNTRFTVEEENEIQTYAISKKKQIELIGLDTLALEILSKYLILSRDFLGIPIDTGQILPFEHFINEYNNKGNQLSTPLDNEFLNRKNELMEISDFLISGDLVLLSGAPGVGKTKIGIEAIQNFTKSNSEYSAFAISKKDVDIYEDLRISLNVDKNYILLVDDANRQLSNLCQILGLFKEERKGNIKIVLTIRNYAINDILKNINEFKHSLLEIPKFSDKEIVELISSDSFSIKNKKYQDKIVSICDGNARLAVMAARMATEKQSEFLWGNASELLESYFKKYITEYKLFDNTILKKVLGLISFFYSIDRNDKQFLKKLLNTFDIDYYMFNEVVEELHEMELIEIQYNFIRISEQVMATYFFYNVFIKEELLSFKDLIFNYFESKKKRFTDSIVPANNSYGYENVITKIDNNLSEYLEYIIDDNHSVLEFLDLFWFYKPEETLSYFYKIINQFDAPISPKYSTHYEMNDFVYTREQIIDFITRYYHHYTEWFKPSIELGFEYIRRKPEHLPEFIRRIRESLSFDETDQNINFIRQHDFIDVVIDNSTKLHYIYAFFAISTTYLKQSFHVTRNGRKNTVTMYDYILPYNENILTIRKKIWDKLFILFSDYPTEVLDTLTDYSNNIRNYKTEIIKKDLEYVISFIQQSLTSKNLQHSYFVLNFINKFYKYDALTKDSYDELKKEFYTRELLTFTKLQWNKLNDKDEFDFDNWREYNELKAKDIRKSFIFNHQNDFNDLINAIKFIKILNLNNKFNIDKSIDIIIEENFKINQNLGFSLLKAILLNSPDKLTYLYSTARIITNYSKEWCLKFWKELERYNYTYLLNWKLDFFTYLKKDHVNNLYCKKLIRTLDSINNYAHINTEIFIKYSILKKSMPYKVIKKISKLNKKNNIVISYNAEMFSKNIECYKNKYKIIKESYFQQYGYDYHYDYNCEAFSNIFSLYPIFLKDFVTKFYNNKNNNNKNLKLGFIWNNTNNTKIIEDSIDFIINNNQYIAIGEHEINIFFNDLNENQAIYAKDFLNKYIVKIKDDYKKLNVIFDGIRHCFNDYFENFLLTYLSLCSNLETFYKIDWVGNVGIVNGDVIWGELYAKRWENILDIVNKFPDTLKIIPVKEYLRKKIKDQYMKAERERAMKFSSPELF